jgi:lysozyme family protein
MTTPAERLQACLAFTLLYEGGYQDRSDDRGNFFDGRLIGTNFGISAPTLAAWLGPERAESLSAADMRALTVPEARAIYAANYWNVVQGDHLPAGIDLVLFDFAVLAGPRRSVSIVQAQLSRLLGTVAVDGFMGPRTRGAIARMTPGALIPHTIEAQRMFLRGLAAAQRNPGWFKRLDARAQTARKMAGGNHDD